MPYTIRKAMPPDYAAINKLCVEAYMEFEPLVGAANWQLMQEVLSKASDLSDIGEFILAENNQQLLGVIVYIPPGNSDGMTIPAEWASIRMLAVSPLYRGKGIGKKLTQECVDSARRDKPEAIGLTTGDMMRIAQPMYERMGFKKDAELGSRMGVKHARYVLMLNQAI
jgi:ribosomal protein S18 acetylase RimI-like enzyme